LTTYKTFKTKLQSPSKLIQIFQIQTNRQTHLKLKIKMSALVKNTALVLLGVVGALAAVNTLTQPSKAAGIANVMRVQLDEQNAHVEQDRQ
jgi:hypothetical protein